ncbi:MAG: DUF1653 domain-containing protein [Rickettsiaceae bacterium]|nr:DUF1653 domain-containing protein [Rickettsiaceae bacterium]
MKLGIYEHYSGKRYQVIGVARNSETHQEFVVYQTLYDDFGLWLRPVEIFSETLEIKGVPVPRFKFISNGVAEAPKVR